MKSEAGGVNVDLNFLRWFQSDGYKLCALIAICLMVLGSVFLKVWLPNWQKDRHSKRIVDLELARLKVKAEKKK